MRLFLKHLLRSIKKWPLQPLVLVFAVAFSVAFCSSAISLRGSVLLENERAIEVRYGSADLTVGINGGSDSRLMLAERANALLGEKGMAIGCFDLVLSAAGGERIFAYASDLHSVAEVFDLSFDEYGGVTEETLADALFITKRLAEELCVSLGDSISFDLLGSEKNYQIAGISADPLVGGKEALVDIRGITKVLAHHSALVSALGEGFMPATSLFVDLAEEVSVEEGIAILCADRDFSDKTFSDLTSIKNSALNEITMNFVISAAVAMVALVSAAVTFSCFYILSIKRSDENATFLVVGTSLAFLQQMQFGEAILYWFIGAPIGFLLSWPLGALFDLCIGFRYVETLPSLLSVLISVLSSLLSVLFAVALFVRTGNLRRKEKNANKALLIMASCYVFCAVFSLVFDGDLRLYAGVIGVALSIAFLVLSAPSAFKKCADLPRALAAQKGRIPPHSLLLALKNSRSVRVLHNTARLVSLVFLAIVSTGALVMSSAGYSRQHETMLRGDYAVTNPTERLCDALSADSSAQISLVYQQTASFVSGHPVIVFAADSVEVFGEEMNISALPKENGVILSSTTANFLSAREGDRLELLLEGERRSLVVSSVSPSGLHFAVIVGAYNQVDYNLLLASADEAHESALYEKLTSAAAKEMSAVFVLEELLISGVELLDIFLVCGYIIAAALFVFALVGLVDNLYESYKHRRADFALFSCAGASTRAIRKMKRCEIAYSILFGCVYGVALSIPLLFVLNQAAYSLDFEIFRCIRALFVL